MIGVIDYGAGNLRSVYKAFQFLGRDVRLVTAPEELDGVHALVLPGVGAFGDGMRGLESRGFIDPLKRYLKEGKPFLGICLGLQFLFESSEECPGIPGLGIFKGRVIRFRGQDKIPHMGWNTVRFTSDGASADAPFSGYYYFVHSFYAEPAESSLLWGGTDYGVRFASAIRHDRIQAVQFHPEKSQRLGLKFLEAWSAAC